MQVEMERVPPSNLRLLLLMGKVKLKVSSLFIDLELKLRSYQGCPPPDHSQYYRSWSLSNQNW